MIREHIFKILEEIGENPKRKGLVKTPERFEEAILELTSGYKDNIEEIIRDGIFESDYKDLIIVKDIDFVSLCEHHLLPFYGKVHVAYIPDGKIVGLSKISKVIDMFSRRLQVQETLTGEISDTLQKIIKPAGVAVMMEAVHLCMVIRGVKKNSSIVTSSMTGIFNTDIKLRDEFFNLLKKEKK